MVDAVIEGIINSIKDLPLKEVLAYLVAKKIIDYSKKGYEKIKKIIQDKQNEGKYFFVPNKEESKKLLEFGMDPGYRGIEALVPNYRYIDLIRTGLLLKQYQTINDEEHNLRARNIKSQIANRPNGGNLLKIVRLPTTPFFSTIIDFLYELKKQGYVGVFLEEKFNEFVSTWQKTSKFITRGDKADDVTSFCERHVGKKTDTFFILGIKSAKDIVETAIEKLVKKKYFESNGYALLIKRSIKEPRKIEVTVFLEH